jgi:hypothetical protein
MSLTSIDDKVADIDKRLAVVEAKVEMQASIIEEIKEMIVRVDEKIDKLIEVQTFNKWKHGLMYGGFASGVLAILQIILEQLGK